MGCKYIIWDRECDSPCDAEYCEVHLLRKCGCGAQSAGDLGIYGSDICNEFPKCQNGV